MSKEKQIRDADRYLSILRWAKERYTYVNLKGERVYDVSIGGKPSRFSCIEELAFCKYVLPYQEIV